MWSVDNELAHKDKERASRRRPRGRNVVRKKTTKPGGGRVIVSGAMLMEAETVLQTQVLSFFLNLELWGCGMFLFGNWGLGS